jgi:hypothetical protein
MPPQNTLQQEAMRNFALQDIFLTDSNVWSSRKLALGATIKDPTVEFRLSEQSEVAVIEVETPEKSPKFAVHYFVGTFVRLCSGPIPAGEANEDQLVATVAATFLVRYLSDIAPTRDMLQAFNENAVHHAWPYWRELVESMTTRLRVPTVIIPMRVPGTGAGGAISTHPEMSQGDEVSTN